jgi:GNAT superfamily N-acetyltransferase
MSDSEPFRTTDVTSEVECHREEVLDLDTVFRSDAGIDGDRPRGGWACSVSLFILEDNYALNEEVETEIAFATYNIGDDDVCEVVDMEVATAYRGRGLARRLVEEALADIALKGGTRVYLFAYEPEEGSRVDFFSRFGFVPLPPPDEPSSSNSMPHPMRLDIDEARR